MIWLTIIVVILILLSIWQFINTRNQQLSIEGFELLLTKFIEWNQQFYDGQKTILKKDKEVMETFTKQTAELSIMRKYSSQINNAIRVLGETTKSIQTNTKESKETNEELQTSKEIANALASASNNIKILDKMAVTLQQSLKELENLKRRMK